MNNNFSEQDFMTRAKPHADRLIAHLQKNGIEMSHGEDGNMVFTGKGKEVKISRHSFYGFSRMGAVRRDSGESQFEFIPVTDEMFIGGVMKSIMETHFGLSKK